MTDNTNNSSPLMKYFEEVRGVSKYILNKLEKERVEEIRNNLRFQLLTNLSSLQSATEDVLKNVYEKMNEDENNIKSCIQIIEQQQKIIQQFEKKFGVLKPENKPEKIELSEDELVDVSKMLIDKLFTEQDKGGK